MILTPVDSYHVIFECEVLARRRYTFFGLEEEIAAQEHSIWNLVKITNDRTIKAEGKLGEYKRPQGSGLDVTIPAYNQQI